MATALENTASDGLERGFDLCLGPEDIAVNVAKDAIVPAEGSELSSGEKCRGEICYINISDCLTHNKRPMGRYHTHPSGDTSPSAGDLLSLVISHNRDGRPAFGCRGGGDTVQCEYIPNPPPPSQVAPISEEYGANVVPLYNKWAADGSPPPYSDPRWNTYDRTLRFFRERAESVKLPTSLLIEGGEIRAMLTPERQHQEQAERREAALRVADQTCRAIIDAAQVIGEAASDITTDIRRGTLDRGVGCRALALHKRQLEGMPEDAERELSKVSQLVEELGHGRVTAQRCRTAPELVDFANQLIDSALERWCGEQ